MYKTDNHFRSPVLTEHLGSIMVVDDETDIARLFQLYLEGPGYYVDIFDDPLKALLEFKPRKYDLVLLDVSMPRMNGFELYQRLNLIDPTCKVCFITAFEVYYNSLKEFFPNLDVTCYIRKPVTQQELLSTIAKELAL